MLARESLDWEDACQGDRLGPRCQGGLQSDIGRRLRTAALLACGLLAQSRLSLMAGGAAPSRRRSLPRLPRRPLARGAGAWACRAPPSMRAFRGRRARPVAARSHAAGQERRKGQAEFTRTPAQYLSANVPRHARASRAGPCNAARRRARQDRARARRASASSCSPSGAARRPSARTSSQLLRRSRRWPRRPIPAAARTCSAPSCSTR